MRGRRALLAALLAAPGAAVGVALVARSAPPPCEATVSVEPGRAVPGQQVQYRLSLLVRSDVREVAWEEPPRFPGLRAERLAAASLGRAVERGGASYELREERRALFAERPGRIALPPARVVCRARGDGAGRSASSTTHEALLEVVPFPEAQVPQDFEGLVGPIVLRHRVTPRSVSLGQSVRIRVTLQGEGNLWDARAPELSPEALGGADVFARPAELELDRGTTLVVRRHFALDVVPRREGVLRLPSLAWRSFDPATGSVAEAVTEPVEVAVGPPAAGGDVAERSADLQRARPPAEDPGERGATFAWAAGIAAALLLGAAAVAGARRLRRRRDVARAVALALAGADAARGIGDRDGELAALARALRAAVAAELGAAADGPPDAILAAQPPPRARSAVELLARLERARFDPAATPPDRSAVLRALGASGRAPRAGRAE